jgi:transcription termination/antitermination protein NusG
MNSFPAERWDSNSGAMGECAIPNPRLIHTDPEWYALQVRPRFEKKVEFQLRAKGIETYLPVVRQVRWWSDRRKLIETPLFAGYVFVRLQLSPKERILVLRTTGVMAFVGFLSGATPVRSAQIDSLRRLLDSNMDCFLRPFLRTGQRVRIRGGSLEGLEGILINDGKHLMVSIDCIQQSIAIRIEGYDLENA